MKKSKGLAIIILVFLSFQAQSQDNIVITGTKKVDKKLTPQQVVDSLNARFPDAKSVQYYKGSAEAAKKGWAVTEEDNLPSNADLDYYTISFKRNGLKYYGLYNKDGEMLQSKVEETVDHLPEPVVTSIKAIAKDYPGYKLVSKTYYKNQNQSKTKEYYEVVAKDGKNKKTLYYAPDGTLIKMKG